MLWALQALCEGNLSVTDGLPHNAPVMQSFDVYFVINLDKLWTSSRVAFFLDTPALMWSHYNELLVAYQYELWGISLNIALTLGMGSLVMWDPFH